MGQQNVTSVEHLELASASLEVWCSSRNAGLKSLDFSGFGNLAAIECFQCTGLESITLGGTRSLKRLCVEDADLVSLDISDSDAMTDLRGALNTFTSVAFPPATAENPAYRHICLRDNPQLGALPSFQDWVELGELLIWNAGQTGTLDLSGCQKLSIVLAYTNAYTGADLGSTVFIPSSSVNLAHNAIVSIDLAGTAGLHELILCDNALGTISLSSMADRSVRHLDLSANALSAESVEDVLATMASWGIPGVGADFYVRLEGGTNAQLTAAATASKASLISNGWTVTDNGAIQ